MSTLPKPESKTKAQQFPVLDVAVRKWQGNTAKYNFWPLELYVNVSKGIKLLILKTQQVKFTVQHSIGWNHLIIINKTNIHYLGSKLLIFERLCFFPPKLFRKNYTWHSSISDTYNILAFNRIRNSSSTFHGHPDFSVFKKVLWRWKKGDYFRCVVVLSLLDSAWLWAWDPYEIVPGGAISVWVRWEIFLLRATFNPSQPTSRLYQLRKRGVMCWCAACV